MWNRKWLLGAIVASAVGAGSTIAIAAHVNIPPPEPRLEILPAERPGYVWAPGHYVWRDGRYQWVKGRWIRERVGMYWHPGHWVERDGRWVFVEPRWRNERFAYGYGRGYARIDRDRDGIPDRFERPRHRVVPIDRDRDGVPDRVDRDRDNDGVPNRFDSAPDNPYRR